MRACTYGCPHSFAPFKGAVSFDVFGPWPCVMSLRLLSVCFAFPRLAFGYLPLMIVTQGHLPWGATTHAGKVLELGHVFEVTRVCGQLRKGAVVL